MKLDVPKAAPTTPTKRRKTVAKRRPKASVAKAPINTAVWTGPGEQLADTSVVAPNFLPPTEPVPTIQLAIEHTIQPPIQHEVKPPAEPRKRKWSDAKPEVAPIPESLLESMQPLPKSNGRNLLSGFLTYFQRLRAPQKRLRVCESVSLGEKRFLAIVRVDSESFLLGGSTGSVSMLAKLNSPDTFSSVLKQKSAEGGSLQ